MRWASAAASEAATGLASCDGDPLKLSYDDCLARIAALPWEQFNAGVDACTTAIREHRLGIADASSARSLMSRPSMLTASRLDPAAVLGGAPLGLAESRGFGLQRQARPDIGESVAAPQVQGVTQRARGIVGVTSLKLVTRCLQQLEQAVHVRLDVLSEQPVSRCPAIPLIEGCDPSPSAGVGSVHPHMLRTGFIMAVLDAGVPLRDVQIAAARYELIVDIGGRNSIRRLRRALTRNGTSSSPAVRVAGAGPVASSSVNSGRWCCRRSSGGASRASSTRSTRSSNV